MKSISWQFVIIVAVIVLSVLALELYALSQGVDGTILSVVIAGLIAIPSVIITRRISTKDKK